MAEIDNIIIPHDSHNRHLMLLGFQFRSGDNQGLDIMSGTDEVHVNTPLLIINFICFIKDNIIYLII